MNTHCDERAFKLITERCAAKIREAHRVADEQRKYLEFIRKEINNGAEFRQAVDSAVAGWPDLKFLEEITEIIEATYGVN